MGIKKRTIETYVCDRKTCNTSSENPGDFEVLDQLINGKKEKIVLCAKDAGRHKAFMEEYEVEGATTTAPEDKDYDPQTAPVMQKLTPAERTKHHAAKVWAMGPDTTMAKDYRPKSVRGLAGPKVLAAYDKWLREKEIKEAAEKLAAEAKQPVPA